MAKLITLFTLVLVLSFALSYAAGPAPAGNTIRTAPAGNTNPAPGPRVKVDPKVFEGAKVLEMEDENCERIFGKEDCLLRRTKAAAEMANNP